MKKTLLSILLATAASVAFGQGQGELTTTTTTTATGKVQTTEPKPRPPAAVPLVPIEGVVQAAIRHGQPVQMINPAAPAEYGNGKEHVSHDAKDPGKPKGIVLFAWTF
ncbi:MAG: hypothetical protein H0T83_07685 [Chthoniobacterales bacterium]|nr:hypothetical protein [Chthoniobacterales bacterium]